MSSLLFCNVWWVELAVVGGHYCIDRHHLGPEMDANSCVSLCCPSLFSNFDTLYTCSTHMQDLKETTDKVHYENFRQLRLSQSQGIAPGESNI